MTDLEKRAEEYCESVYSNALVQGCCMYSFCTLKDACIEFAQQETALLSKHILELQADKGILTDELNTCQGLLGKEKVTNVEQSLKLTEAKEIIRDFISVAIDYIDKEDKNYSLIVEAEAFINKE